MVTSSFKEEVIPLTRRINTLVSTLRGAAKQSHQSSHGIQDILGEYELRQLRFIAVASHKLTHDDQFKIKGDEGQFLDTCRWLVVRLEAHVKARERTQPASPPREVRDAAVSTEAPSRPKPELAALGTGALCLLVLPFVFTRTVGRVQWPPSLVLTETATNWPPVIFWTVMLVAATYHTARYIVKRR